MTEVWLARLLALGRTAVAASSGFERFKLTETTVREKFANIVLLPASKGLPGIAKMPKRSRIGEILLSGTQ